MANADIAGVVRFGQTEVAGDVWQLFLMEFSGMVLTQFETRSKFWNRFMTQTRSSGKAFQFPVFGRGGTERHVAGEFIQGQVVPTAERTITVDDLLIAPRSIAQIDELVSHFDARQPIANDIGEALARDLDRQLAQTLVLGARVSAATARIGGGGSVILHPDMATSTTRLIDSIVLSARVLAEKNVPEDQRVCYIRPAQYFAIVASGDPRVFDMHLNAGQSNGGLVSGKVFGIAGIPLEMTNHLPNTNITTGLEKYRGDFTRTVAVVGHYSAVGTAQLMGVTTEAEWEMRYQSTFMIGKVALGMGWVRPEAIVEIGVGTATNP
jgi:hypothetical protein